MDRRATRLVGARGKAATWAAAASPWRTWPPTWTPARACRADRVPHPGRRNKRCGRGVDAPGAGRGGSRASSTRTSEPGVCRRALLSASWMIRRRTAPHPSAGGACRLLMSVTTSSPAARVSRRGRRAGRASAAGRAGRLQCRVRRDHQGCSSSRSGGRRARGTVWSERAGRPGECRRGACSAPVGGVLRKVGPPRPRSRSRDSVWWATTSHAGSASDATALLQQGAPARSSAVSGPPARPAGCAPPCCRAGRCRGGRRRRTRGPPACPSRSTYRLR